MEPKRRPIGMPMEMMKAVVDYQLDDRLAPLESPEKQIEFAKKRIWQRERRFEKTEKVVIEQLKEKSEKFGEIEGAIREIADHKPFTAVEIQIPNLIQALEEQQKMYRVAVKSLELTRGQLRHTREENLILTDRAQSLQSQLKAKKKQNNPFLDELGNKAGTYAADPNHHRYDRYRNQSSYERSRI